MPIQSTPISAPGTAGGAVNDAIRDAARTTGTSFAYLLATAKVESGLDPRQASPTSSARGLFQFIDQTWLMMLKESGSALGYGQYAQAIATTPSGGYEVADPAARNAVLALRDDPLASAALAGAFTQRNAAQLSATLGRNPTEGELYIAHFLGAGGAARLISLAATNPTTNAAQIFPGAASANPSIFFDRLGNARTAAGVYSNLVGRYERAAVATSATVQAVGAGVATTPADARPQPVQTAMAEPTRADRPPGGASTTPIFHGLFQSDPDRGGVSRFITELWGSRPQVAAALSGAGIASTERVTATRR